MDDLKANVSMAPWLSDMVSALKVFVDSCKEAGVPIDKLRRHIDSLVEDAAREAITIER